MIAVHTIVYGDKANITAGENNICVLSDGQIVSPKAAQILDDPAPHQPLLDQFQTLLHTGTIKIRPSVAIVYQYLEVCVAMIVCVSC